MHKKLLIFAALALILPSIVFGQSASRRRNTTYEVQFTSNVPGAMFSIDGAEIKDGFPFTIRMASGIHEVTASAPGYQNYEASFEVSGPMSWNIELEPLMARVRLNLSALVDRRNRNAVNEIQILLNDEPVSTNFEASGRSRITIISGGLKIEEVFNFQPGQEYTLTPQVDLNLQPGR